MYHFLVFQDAVAFSCQILVLSFIQPYPFGFVAQGPDNCRSDIRRWFEIFLQRAHPYKLFLWRLLSQCLYEFRMKPPMRLKFLNEYKYIKQKFIIMLIKYHVLVVEEVFFQLGHPSTALNIGDQNMISKGCSNKFQNKIHDVSTTFLV